MSSPHRFVVRRQVYTPPDATGVRRVLPEKHDRHATFRTAELAFVEQTKQLTEFRRVTNPFQLGGPNLFYQTSLPAFAFHDYLLDHNIPPPSTSLTAHPNYVFWWMKNNRTFTDRERERVWAACDKLKPFDVIEEDDRKAVFVVMERPFREWADTERAHQELAIEGGSPQSAFNKLQHARAASKRHNEQRRADVQADWLAIPSDRNDGIELVEADEMEFTEIVSVSGGGRPESGPLLLVVRQGYRKFRGEEAHVRSSVHMQFAQVPLSYAATQLEAFEHRDRLVARVRRTVNPFAMLRSYNAFGPIFSHEGDEARLPNGLTVEDAVEIVQKLPTVPPAPDVLSAEWYDRVVNWSPEFIDVIWSTFADFQLFEVIELPIS